MSITPGKWKRMGHLIVGEHGTPICSLSSSSLLVGSVGEREANGNAIKEVPNMIEVLKDWLSYAVSNLSEFDGEKCDPDGDLCPRCMHSGCINLKIRNTRAILKRIEG